MKIYFDVLYFILYYSFLIIKKFRLINFHFLRDAVRGFGSDYLYFRITNTCVLQFYFFDHVRFYPLGYKSFFSLQKSYNNYLMFSKDNCYLNYKFEFNDNYYSCDLLDRLPNELSFIYEADVLERSKLDSTELNVIRKIFYKKFNIKIDNFLIFNEILDHNFEKGFIHGDLTPDNVMLNLYGDFVFIDLDRSFSPGPLLFDKLHFYIESKREKNNWLEFLFLSYRDGVLNQFEVFFYIMYRLYLEFNCSLSPSYLLRKKVSNFLESF